jgi:hypothetical protein
MFSTAGLVIGAVVSAPLVLACIKGARFFGKMEQTVSHLGETVEALTETLTEFSGDVRSDLAYHGERLAAVETELSITPPERVGRYDRRHRHPRSAP